VNLYLCSQNQNSGYDVYDSFICAANSADEAKNTLPNGGYVWGGSYGTWCVSPDYVDVKLIGVATDNVEHGVVLASFNAG
jgi:hypothetical protein